MPSHKGEHHHKAKVSKEDVIDIRVSYWLKGKSYPEIAASYGLSHWGVRHIINGETWGHVWMPSEQQKSDRPEHKQDGEKGPTAKLTDQQVVDMRRLSATGIYSAREIRDLMRLPVAVPTARSAINGTTFKHLPPVESFKQKTP